MHHICILLTGMLFFLPASFSAWSQRPDPTPPVTLSMRNVPLQEILLEIEKQTGVFFSYESSMLAEFPEVSLSVKNESLSYSLERLFSSLPVIYRFTGKNIILKRKPLQFTISGFVRDSASYESLLNASVFDKVSGIGATSNNYGFYSITLPPGKVRLRCSYVGYEPKEITINLARDTLVDIPLTGIGSLKEVVVEGLNPRSGVMSSRSGVVAMPAQRIKSMPALLGETDVVKTLQRIPGVAIGTEGMSGLFVRGGNADENLYLLDGNPVYHTNHLLGFFSAFNPDAVKNATFYKGSFPAEYGGRLSSVIDVRTNDGDRQEYHGNISVGMLALRGNLEGPIIKDRSSFNVSVRRTWMEAITLPVLMAVNKGEDTKIKNGYHFFDMNAKVNHSFSDNSRLYLSFYMGSDSYRDGKVSDDKEATNTDFRWRWGNLIGSAGWNHVINDKLFASFTAGYTRYRSHIIQEKDMTISSTDGALHQQLSQKGHYRSSMEDVSLRASFDYSPQVNHRIRMGAEYLFHIFRPEGSSMYTWNRDSADAEKVNTIYSNSLVHGHELSLYGEDEVRLTDRLNVTAGLRYTQFLVQGESYQSFQPRLSARYLLNRKLSAKLSYSKMNQYIQLLSNSYISQPSDIWVPVTRQIRPRNAHQYTAGLYYNLNKTFDFSAEAYYKQMNNLIEYKDMPLGMDYMGWESQVGVGKGRSYGVELMAQKKKGRLSGWIGYTLSWSDRWFPDGSVNNGKRYPARNDNRHKVDVVATYKLSKKIELTATWIYASGNHLTIEDQVYTGGEGQVNNGYPGDNVWTGGQGTSASSRNNYQLAPYHRLDVGANFYRYKKKGRMGIWNLSICNAYLQPNPFSVRPAYDFVDGKRRVVLEQTILFMCLPSLSYTYKF